MCDVSEGIPSTPMTRFERKRVPGKCIKCKTAQPNVTIRGCLYCKPCFVRASIAKFRTALSKSRKRAEGQATDRAMVALSGGASSSSMLQLTLDYHRAVAMKGGSAQPLYGDVVVGHIDESALFGAPVGDQGGIAGIVGKGIGLHCARLEDVFAAGEEGEQPVLLQIVRANIAPGAGIDSFCAQLVRPADSAEVAPKEQLARLFAGLGSATNREAMLEALKTFLLVRLARTAGCNVLLLGDSATRIATKIVDLTSRGRGFSLPLEVSSESSWFAGLTAMRPMRDFTAKEIAFFVRWTAQRTVVVPTFTTGALPRASIGRLTEAFVVGLDRDFASTVSTVCRTVQKLEPSPEALSARPCIVCAMPVEPGAQAWRSRLTVSDPQQGQSLRRPGGPVVDSGSVGLDIASHLCYSCQDVLHFADSDGLELPGFSADRYRSQVAAQPVVGEDESKHEALRKQVEHFFLAGEDDDE